jgi:hypothetical protein
MFSITSSIPGLQPRSHLSLHWLGSVTLNRHEATSFQSSDTSVRRTSLFLGGRTGRFPARFSYPYSAYRQWGSYWAFTMASSVFGIGLLGKPFWNQRRIIKGRVVLLELYHSVGIKRSYSGRNCVLQNVLILMAVRRALLCAMERSILFMRDPVPIVNRHRT